MLCKNCREQFGHSFKYLAEMIKQYQPEHKGIAIDDIKAKMLLVVEGDTEVFDRIEAIEKRLKKMELD